MVDSPTASQARGAEPANANQKNEPQPPKRYLRAFELVERVRATMRDVTIQILALEDNYIRNEKEQEKRDVIEREDRLRAMAEVREKAIEITAAAAAGSRTAPQSSSVLRLLSPSYNKF